ncbi:MAG TPA: hypothetical protein VF533_22695 [Solirubrobacteraceae bacterium]
MGKLADQMISRSLDIEQNSSSPLYAVKYGDRPDLISRVSLSGTVALLVVVALIFALPASVEARSYSIVPGRYAVKRIGPFKTTFGRTYQPTIGAAVGAFGRPSSRFEKGGGCILKWRRLGLRIEFWNFGGWRPDQTICSDEVGLAQAFRAKGRRFRSWRGLRVGMTEDRLLELHPHAEWFDGDRYSRAAWWLAQQYSPYGDGGPYAILAAPVHGDRVSELDGWTGAAGE